MFEMVRRAKKNQKGFTLVELMVVVVIIGVLIMIAIPAYNMVTARAERGACVANQRMIQGAIVQWQIAEDEDPTVFPGMTDLATAGDYFMEEPICPTDESSYTIDATTGAVTCDNGHTP